MTGKIEKRINENTSNPYAGVTGDFDENGDLANPDLIQLLDPRPAPRMTQGGKGKRNNKSQKHHPNDEEKKPQHTVFKYSRRFRGPLRESIILGCEPFFLTYSEADGHLGLMRQIEENNRILVSPSVEEYPYEPIEFSSKKEIKDYEGMALNETIDSLY